MSHGTKRIGSVRLENSLWAEESRSPQLRLTRSFEAAGVGWIRERTLTRVLITEKALVPACLIALKGAPAPLLTYGGEAADGTSEPDINWGVGYQLEGAETDSWDNSPTLTKLTVPYTRTLAEAFDAPPAGLTITCAAGVCTVAWRGTPMVSWDSGLQSCTSGLTAERAGTSLIIKCNGVQVASYANASGLSTGSGFVWSVGDDGLSIDLVWDDLRILTWTAP